MIDPKGLTNFAEIYGTSAFVCRTLHCPFSTDGFSTSKQRNDHEVQHRPKLHCGNNDCFSIGFSTRSQLNRHNEKYHPVRNKETSLVDAIRSLNIDSSPTPQTEKKVQVSANTVRLEQNMNSGPPNTTEQIQQLIYQAVTARTVSVKGWQNQLLIQERIGLIFHLYVLKIRLDCWFNSHIGEIVLKICASRVKTRQIVLL